MRWANTLQNLRIFYIDLGRFHEAARCHRRRLSISRETGDIPGVANPLGSLGAIRIWLGESDAALRLLTASYWLQRRFGNRESELVVGNDLGVLHRRSGRHHEAVVRHRAALAIAQEVGDIANVCIVLTTLGGHCGRLATGLLRWRSTVPSSPPPRGSS